ncbi:MAG: MBG-2 domain-containing protein, partial [Erysipelotrichaceae bacterium]|nr:MBG-2 domain-containing protein [Erysipelotrichaceae bacterium]
ATATDVTTTAVAATCDTLVIKNSKGETVDNNMFTIDKKDGSITVTPKTVTIVVNNKSKTYGDNDPQFDGSVTGLVNQNDLGTVTYDRKPEDAGKEDVGDDITLVASYTANSNYTVQVTEGKLTINKSSSLTVTGDDYYGVYDGQAHGTAATPSVTDGTTLTYTVNGESSSTYPTITDVGSKTVTVVAVNSNYNNATDTYTLTVVPQSINPNDPTDPDPTDPTKPVYVNISINSPSDYPYDGYEHKWAPTVTDGNGNALTEGTDYTVTYDKEDFTNVTGDITVTITGTGNYGGTVTRKYKITPKEVTIVVDNKSKTYGEDDPTFTGTVGTLVNENDLGTVTYGRKTEDANKEDAGDDITLVPTYTANSNYTVQVTEGKLTITAKSIIIPDPEDPEDPEKAKDMVANDPTDVVYNGEDQKWVPTLKDGETTLVKDTDYTVTYSSDTKNVGTVTVTITGKDNYSGTVTRTYQITPATLTVVTPTDSKVYDGTALTKAGSVSGWVKNETAPFSTTGTQTEVGSSDNTYEIEWNDPTATAKESNYTISATVGKLTVT